MKFNRPILIAGFGSIGRRHVQNLRALGHKKFVLYRTGKSTLPDEEIAGIPTESDLDKALAHKPIATIIANPTAMHLPIAIAAAKAGSHLFLEKPISHTLDGVIDLQRLVKKKNLVVQVGFQFRFHPGLRKVKKQLEKGAIGKVVSVQAHWGQYLPGWHPWEDYRKSYAANAALGGGALLTLCHPFDYLRWLIGEFESVCAVEGRSSGLGIDVEDTADVLLRFKRGATGHVHLNYLERREAHTLRIIGESGIISWDNAKPLKNFERNTLYESEMRHFLACIAGNEQPLCTLEDGIKTLKIVLAAKESVRKKRLVEL